MACLRSSRPPRPSRRPHDQRRHHRLRLQRLHGGPRALRLERHRQQHRRGHRPGLQPHRLRRSPKLPHRRLGLHPCTRRHERRAPDKLRHTPYGATTTSGAASTNAVQYSGRENDNNGLYYYRARYYNPTTGRFISEDPAGLAAGINIYAYAADDPVDLADPSGMFIPIAAACLGGAAFNVALDLFSNWLSGRKSTLGGLLVSAAVGCIAGLAFMGLGAFLSEPIDALAQVTLNRLSGLAAELGLRDALGAVARTFWTPMGNRIVDAFSGGVAREAKVGLVAATDFVKSQVAKDAWLSANNPEVSRVVWYFYKSAVTGGQGPTGPLRALLEANHFQIVIVP